MAESNFIILETRDLLMVSGTDAGVFLQNLISNDVNRVDAGRIIYATLLTPQGKFLHDFFVAAHPQASAAYIIETEASRTDDLEKRLSMYRLRSDVTLEPAPQGWAVFAAFGGDAAQNLNLEPTEGMATNVVGGVAFIDPRLAALGVRTIGPTKEMTQHLEEAGFTRTETSMYERLRLSLGVPDGSRDILVDKSFPLECNLDDLNAIDYQKGCYVGQELTARTHHRAKIRKRLIPVRLDGPLPDAGTTVTLEGRDIGEMRSGVGQRGLALLRIESLKSAAQSGQPLMAGVTEIVPDVPAWLKLDDPLESDSA